MYWVGTGHVISSVFHRDPPFVDVFVGALYESPHGAGVKKQTQSRIDASSTKNI